MNSATGRLPLILVMQLMVTIISLISFLPMSE
jgi:hypothetical protein